MLEFNIDKQGGIKLHTCERKSRWCKFWLWMSWVSVFALLGWLFLKGFLDFDKMGIGQPALSKSQLTAPINNEEAKTLIPDCPEIESSQTVALNTKNKALAESCDKKISALNAQLKELSELKESNQKLELSAKSLDNLKADLLKEKTELTKQLADKILENNKLTKKLSDASKANVADKQKASPDVKEKLFFYEEILDVNGGKQVVSINHFVLKKDEKSGLHRLQMVLARLGQSKVNSRTTGTFEVFLKGNKRVEVAKEANESENKTTSESENKSVSFTKELVTYKHTDLIPDDALEDSHSFSFKYYQNLESEIELPEFFELESVSVGIKPQGLPSVSKNYEWKDLEKLSFKEMK